MKKQNYIIVGVDGGGTKTDAWAVGLDGRLLGKGRSGPSNLRNSGIKDSALAVAEAIKKSTSGLKRKKILSAFIGLAAIEEEYKGKENGIKKEILKYSKALSDAGKVIIGSDQEAAFRSGTDEKEGVIVIAGTGCVARGWKKGKVIKSSGWGWLADEGSACWAGQQLYQKVLREIDGREPKTTLYEIASREIRFKNAEELNRKVYGVQPVAALSRLSLAADLAARMGDKEAGKIFEKAGEELSLAALTVIKKLRFGKEFPLILVGGMFKSSILTETFKRKIKKNSPRAKIIIPSDPPVYGAVKMAREKYGKS